MLALCILLNDSPLLNEPGVKKTHKDYEKYNKVIAYKNIEVAIYDTIKSPATLEHFPMFLNSIKQKFMDNYDAIITKIDLCLTKNDEREPINTVVYNMSTIIDYKQLKIKIMDLRKSIALIL